jgi:hypothetical protein
MPKIVQALPRKDYLNLTSIMVMANSNLAMKDNERFWMFKKDMKYLIEERILGDPQVADYLFGDSSVVDEVRPLSAASERGKKQNRAHFNLTVEIYHTVPKYSAKKLKERFKIWLDENYQLSKGWNVYTTLLPMKKVNYANKEERYENNDRQEDDNPEIERLSAPGELVEMKRLGKLIRKLVL